MALSWLHIPNCRSIGVSQGYPRSLLPHGNFRGRGKKGLKNIPDFNRVFLAVQMQKPVKCPEGQLQQACDLLWQTGPWHFRRDLVRTAKHVPRKELLLGVFQSSSTIFGLETAVDEPEYPLEGKWKGSSRYYSQGRNNLNASGQVSILTQATLFPVTSDVKQTIYYSPYVD